MVVFYLHVMDYLYDKINNLYHEAKMEKTKLSYYGYGFLIVFAIVLICQYFLPTSISSETKLSYLIAATIISLPILSIFGLFYYDTNGKIYQFSQLIDSIPSKNVSFSKDFINSTDSSSKDIVVPINVPIERKALPFSTADLNTKKQKLNTSDNSQQPQSKTPIGLSGLINPMVLSLERKKLKQPKHFEKIQKAPTIYDELVNKALNKAPINQEMLDKLEKKPEPQDSRLKIEVQEKVAQFKDRSDMLNEDYSV